MKTPARLPRRTFRRGLTMVELTVAAALFGLVGLFATALIVAAARQSAASRMTIPADGNNYRVVDRIRGEIMGARIGSVTISPDGRTINYLNPARATRGQIEFVAATGELVHRPNVVANPTNAVVWGREMDGRFSFMDVTGKRINIEVETLGLNTRRDQLTIVYSDVVTVRN